MKKNCQNSHLWERCICTLLCPILLLGFLSTQLFCLSEIGLTDFVVYAEDGIEFGYTGTVESYTIPQSGIYLLEAYGAGGSETAGRGGYAKGYKKLHAGDVLYVCVGGQANGSRGGYNGGGNALDGEEWSNGYCWLCFGGNGCTSVTVSDRGELYNFENCREEVLLVAGGAGGGCYFRTYDTASQLYSGYDGGGYDTGGYTNAQGNTLNLGAAGQDYAGTGAFFGKGVSRGTYSVSGGGGGWYGGGYNGDGFIRTAGGGSSYTAGLSDFLYGETEYLSGTEPGLWDGAGLFRITRIAALTEILMTDTVAAGIERQSLWFSARVQSVLSYTWEKTEKRDDGIYDDSLWESLPADCFEQTDSLDENGNGTVTLSFVAHPDMNADVYRLVVSGEDETVYGPLCTTEIEPLRITRLELLENIVTEAGDTLYVKDLKLIAVCNNADVTYDLSEEETLRDGLCFVEEGATTTEVTLRRPMNDRKLVIRLEHEDRPTDLTVYASVVDTTPPVITDVLIEGIRYTNEKEPETLQVTVTAEDAAEGELRYASALYSEGENYYQQPLNTFPLTIHDNDTLLIRVEDESGNKTEAEKEIRFYDGDAPNITAINKTPAGWTAGTVTVTISAEDDFPGLRESPYSFDGGNTWQNVNNTIVNGNGTITVCTEDRAGNRTSIPVTIDNIDRIPPEILEVRQNPEFDWSSGLLEITVEAADKGCGLHEEAYSFDGGRTWQAEPRILLEEPRRVDLLVRDRLGNGCEVQSFETVKVSVLQVAVAQITGKQSPTLITTADTLPEETSEERPEETVQKRKKTTFGKIDLSEGNNEQGKSQRRYFLDSPVFAQAVAGTTATGGTGWFLFWFFRKARVYRIDEFGEEQSLGSCLLRIRRRKKRITVNIRRFRKGEKDRHRMGLRFSKTFIRRYANYEVEIRNGKEILYVCKAEEFIRFQG